MLLLLLLHQPNIGSDSCLDKNKMQCVAKGKGIVTIQMPFAFIAFYDNEIYN